MNERPIKHRACIISRAQYSTRGSAPWRATAATRSVATHSAPRPAADDPTHLWTWSTAGGPNEEQREKTWGAQPALAHMLTDFLLPEDISQQLQDNCIPSSLSEPLLRQDHLSRPHTNRRHTKTSLWLPPYYFLPHLTRLISSFVCTFFSLIILKSVCVFCPSHISLSHTVIQSWCAHAALEKDNCGFTNTESSEFAQSLVALQLKADVDSSTMII